MMNKVSYPNGIKKVRLPVGTKGDASITKKTFKGKALEIHNMRIMISGEGRHRQINPGTYTYLHVGNELMMSDTPGEAWEHWEAIQKAHGRCLINGLGIGLVLKALIAKKEVTEIVVVELNKDVLDLISPHYKSRKVTFIHADALEWRPPKGARFGCVWNDIWPTITTDNWEDMKKLHRAYGRRADWVGSWNRDWVKRLIREEKREADMLRFWHHPTEHSLKGSSDDFTL